MENYVVRIYQRNADNPELLAGQVEIVKQDKTIAFHNFEELKKILSTHKKSSDYKFRVE